jgi:hypothetical protein
VFEGGKVGRWEGGKLGGLAGVSVIHNVVDGRRLLRRRLLDIPLGRGPQRPHGIVDVHRVGPQVLFPQPPHLLALALVHPRHAQRRAQELARVGPVDMGNTQDHQVQAVDLGQVLLGLELPLCLVVPGLQLVCLLAGRRVGLVDHAGAELLEALDVALCGFAADGHGEGMGSQLVDLVVLGEARLAAAVEDIVELLAALAVEYAGQRTCGGVSVLASQAV